MKRGLKPDGVCKTRECDMNLGGKRQLICGNVHVEGHLLTHAELEMVIHMCGWLCDA